MKTMHSIGFALIAMLAAVSSAEQTTWTPHGESQFVGHAINKQTGEPIGGAWILASYVLGQGGVHEQAHCSIAEVVRSNASGEYVLPYHEGLPPQYLDTFAHRFKWVVWPRNVSKDAKLRWVVNVTAIVDGKGRIIAQEGPFATEEEALKASRILQDVWLEPFTGSDDDWLRYLSQMSGWKFGCKSRITAGGVAWRQALLDEAGAMPESAVKSEVMKQLRYSLEQARLADPDGATRSAAK